MKMEWFLLSSKITSKKKTVPFIHPTQKKTLVCHGFSAAAFERNKNYPSKNYVKKLSVKYCSSHPKNDCDFSDWNKNTAHKSSLLDWLLRMHSTSSRCAWQKGSLFVRGKKRSDGNGMIFFGPFLRKLCRLFGWVGGEDGKLEKKHHLKQEDIWGAKEMMNTFEQ